MFQVGNQYGKMSKRGKALDKEIRERIKQLANGLIDSIDIDTLTSNQRINMLKAVLPYLLPKKLSVFFPLSAFDLHPASNMFFKS